MKLLFPALAFSLLRLTSLAQQAPTPDPQRQDWAKLARYAPDNAQLPAPKRGVPRVVLLGNSITEGWPKADPGFFTPKAYELIGRGISGQTSPQMLVRFRQDVLDLRPQVVAIAAGTNDVAQNTGPYQPQATMNNIMSMAELARAHGVKVILCSVLPATDFWWRKGLEPAPKIVALNALIKAYAEQQHFTYLDYHAALADEQQGLPLKYADDGVHPNLAGYQAMEPLLLRAVAQALKQK
jgi:lysophospholipase L1-like esterase